MKGSVEMASDRRNRELEKCEEKLLDEIVFFGMEYKIEVYELYQILKRLCFYIRSMDNTHSKQEYDNIDRYLNPQKRIFSKVADEIKKEGIK